MVALVRVIRQVATVIAIPHSSITNGLRFCDAVLHGHVAGTAANDQLSRRDAEFLGQLFDFDPSFDHRGWSLGRCVCEAGHGPIVGVGSFFRSIYSERAMFHALAQW